jgi:hypothetical protein
MCRATIPAAKEGVYSARRFPFGVARRAYRAAHVMLFRKSLWLDMPPSRQALGLDYAKCTAEHDC